MEEDSTYSNVSYQRLDSSMPVSSVTCVSSWPSMYLVIKNDTNTPLRISIYTKQDWEKRYYHNVVSDFHLKARSEERYKVGYFKEHVVVVSSADRSKFYDAYHTSFRCKHVVVSALPPSRPEAERNEIVTGMAAHIATVFGLLSKTTKVQNQENGTERTYIIFGGTQYDLNQSMTQNVNI